MSDPSGRFSLVFNGEIYNHGELRSRAEAQGWKFRGSSDTEVLLASWVLYGEDVLSALNGMFAFCVVDKHEQSAVLVRDRFGVKPLYFARLKDGLAFASLPQALSSALGLVELDLANISRGLATWAYDTDCSDSAFKGVSALPAGCFMRVDLRDGAAATTEIVRWYDLLDRISKPGRSGNHADSAKELRALIGDSIGLRMRADVPVGLSLSGGLDSSIIAAVASKQAPPVRAFSFSLGESDKESIAVGRLSASLGPSKLKVTRVFPPSASDMLSTLEEALLCQGGPVAGLSSLAQFQVYRAARAEGVTVVLGGQGADEAFMGYRKYQLAALRNQFKSGQMVSATQSGARMIQGAVADRGSLSAYRQAATRYLRGGTSQRGLGRHLPRHHSPAIPSSSESLQVFDIREWGLPMLLRMEDRNSMAHSIESRHPFMDYRVVEYGVALDTRLKVRRGYGKWILRHAFESEIPLSITWARYKRGFDPGTREWLQLGVGLHLRNVIHSRRAAIADSLQVPRAVVDAATYSDAALAKSRAAMHEALVLAWIGFEQDRAVGRQSA